MKRSVLILNLVLFLLNNISAQEFIWIENFPNPEIINDKESLIAAAQNSLKYYDVMKRDGKEKSFDYKIANRTVSLTILEQTLLKFIEILENTTNEIDFADSLKNNFDIFGFQKNNDANVLLTSYYEPIYEVRIEKNAEFIYPLYNTPVDLVEFDFKDFEEIADKKIFECSLVGNKLLPYKEGEKIIVETETFKNLKTGGRLTGRIENNIFIKYYSRREIDIENILVENNLATPIAWFKSITELIDVHIQGSGRLLFDNNKQFRAYFSHTNSLPFASYITHTCKKYNLPITKAAANEYIAANENEVWELMAINPRYVFFELYEIENNEHRCGDTNFPLVPYRSVAVDTEYIPMGSLALIQAKQYSETGNNKINRFVFAHDIGGAIKNLHVDYFVGNSLKTTIYDKTGKFFFLLIKTTNR